MVEQHVQNTFRNARALADKVVRTATEEAERSIQQQQVTVKNFRDPFKHDCEGDEAAPLAVAWNLMALPATPHFKSVRAPAAC